MDLELQYRPTTGRFVTPDLFGGNHLFTRNALEVGGSFDNAVQSLGVNGLRYPGGTMAEKWGVAFYDAPNTEPANAAEGDIFVGLDAFLAYAQATGQPVTIVLPTSHLFDGPAEGAGTRVLKTGAVEKAGAFVAALLEDYPDVEIAGFEIGNEYWNSAVNMTSVEYGIAANAMAIAIQAAMDAVLGAGADQPAILMQMGDVWGRDFDEGVYAGQDLTWMEKIFQANDDILSGMTDAARDAVDGLIEHYYFTETDWALHLGDAPLIDAGPGFHEILHDVRQFRADWDEAAHGALDLAITEWGLSRYADTQFGMPSAGVALEMFEGLLRMGADSASVWPIELNSPTDLAGTHNRPDAPDADKLTPIGEAFRLMAEHVIGLELYNNGFDAADRAVDSVEVNTYGSDERVVVFLSSRSDEAQDVSLDVAAYVDAYESINGVRLVQDNPDLDWDKPYLFAATEALGAETLGGGTSLDVTLGAFEVVMVEYILVPGDPESHDAGGLTLLRGRAQADVLDGTDGRDKILGLAGADRLMGEAGDDVIAGHSGRDRVTGASGDDRIRGGAGRDVLNGGVGDDVLRGGAGNDRLRGGPGNDLLEGGSGDDVFVFAGDGFNTVADFGRGQDRISLRAEAITYRTLDIFNDRFVIGGKERDGALIDYGDGAIFLIGVDADDLSARDFLF